MTTTDNQTTAARVTEILDAAAAAGHDVRRYHDRADIINPADTAILSIRWNDVKDPRALGYDRGDWTPGKIRVHTIKIYDTVSSDATDRRVSNYLTMAAALADLTAIK